MQRNGILVLLSVALVSVAGIVAAYFFTHKPEPEGPSALDQATERLHEEKVACLEGGGTWHDEAWATVKCEHSEPATAPSTSGSGSSAATIAEQVDATYSIAEQRAFCVSAQGLGYTTTRRIWKAQGTQDVFDELWARCLAY